MRRRGAVLAASIATATLALIGPVGAVVVPWTLVGGPITATVFQSTTYTFTATNTGQSNGVGCVEVDFPVEFVIESLGTPVGSDDGGWSSTIYGGTNWVLVHAGSGGERLEIGQSVTFSVQAQATQPGAYDFINHTHRRQDCTGAQVDGAPMGHGRRPRHRRHANAGPNPRPDAGPDAGPTPVPTPKPTPIPTPVPTTEPVATPPVDPTPTERPTPSSSPTASPRSTTLVIPAAAPPPTGPGSAPAAVLAPLQDTESGTSSVGVGTEVFALLNGPLVGSSPVPSWASPACWSCCGSRSRPWAHWPGSRPCVG